MLVSFVLSADKVAVMQQEQWVCEDKCLVSAPCYYNDASNSCYDTGRISSDSSCNICLSFPAELRSQTDAAIDSCKWELKLNLDPFDGLYIKNILDCAVGKVYGFDVRAVRLYANIQMIPYTSTSAFSETICDDELFWLGCLEQRKKDPSCVLDYIDMSNERSWGYSPCSMPAPLTDEQKSQFNVVDYCKKYGYTVTAASCDLNQATVANFCQVDTLLMSCTRPEFIFPCKTCLGAIHDGKKQFKEECTSDKGNGICLYDRNLGKPEICPHVNSLGGNCDPDQGLWCCHYIEGGSAADPCTENIVDWECSASATTPFPASYASFNTPYVSSDLSVNYINSYNEVVSCNIGGIDFFEVRGFLTYYYGDNSPSEARAQSDPLTNALASSLGLSPHTNSNCQGNSYIPNLYGINGNICQEGLDRRALALTKGACEAMGGVMYKNGKECKAEKCPYTKPEDSDDESMSPQGEPLPPCTGLFWWWNKFWGLCE